MKTWMWIGILGLFTSVSSSVGAKEQKRDNSGLQARTPVKSYRVRFTRGHASAVVSGIAGFQNWEPLHNYHVHAKAGQTLKVRLLSGRGRVQFDVYSTKNRGVFVSAGGEDTTRFQSKLPLSGDYVVSIYGIKPNARYRVEIRVG